MPLEEYRRKRDFAATPEPPPGDLAERSGINETEMATHEFGKRVLAVLPRIAREQFQITHSKSISERTCRIRQKISGEKL